MNIIKGSKSLIKTAAAFVAAVFVICYLALFGIPATKVNADVGQPDIPVPALSDVHCASYCVYDKTTGYIVISMNPDDRIYPASMTKIMTCLLSLELLDTSTKLEVSPSALAGLDADSSLMGVLEGEKVKVSELLYGLMLPSGNDAANVLGEGCIDAFFEKYPAGGSAVNADGVNAQYLLDTMHDSQDHILSSRKLEAFALLMNLRADTLGCKGTHFVNACGLPDDNHYTTAYDLTLIMAAASEIDDFNTLISAPSHVFVGTNRHKADAWSYVKNSNYLLYDPWLASKTANGTDSHLSAVIGGKTGTANRVSGRSYSSETNTSFVVMAPMDDPAISMICIVYRPRKVQYGAYTAGPIVKEISEKTLEYLGVERKYTEEEEKKSRKYEKLKTEYVSGLAESYRLWYDLYENGGSPARVVTKSPVGYIASGGGFADFIYCQIDLEATYGTITNFET